MDRIRRRQLRVGVPTGVLAFVAGWTIAAWVVPVLALGSHPRWEATLLIYLGAHHIAISPTVVGADAASITALVPSLPKWITWIPIVAVALAGTYACTEISGARRIPYNVQNALAAGMGYFVAALAAMVVTNIQPVFTTLFTWGLIAAVAILLGSRFVGALTRGLPILGVASLGLIATIGLFLAIGGLAVISILWELLAIAFGIAAGSGVVVGANRQLSHQGSRRGDSTLPQIRGLGAILRTYAKPIVATILIGIALYIGLRGGI